MLQAGLVSVTNLCKQRQSVGVIQLSLMFLEDRSNNMPLTEWKKALNDNVIFIFDWTLVRRPHDTGIISVVVGSREWCSVEPSHPYTVQSGVM